MNSKTFFCAPAAESHPSFCGLQESQPPTTNEPRLPKGYLASSTRCVQEVNFLGTLDGQLTNTAYLLENYSLELAPTLQSVI